MSDMDQFADYFALIRFTAKPYVARAQQVLAMLDGLTPEPITALVIEDAIDSEGTRVYQHMAGLTENFIASADSFLRKEDLSVWSLTQQIRFLNFTSSEYDYVKATDASRLTIQIGLAGIHEVGWHLEGVRENCDHLVEIAAKYLRPHYVSG